MTLIWSLLAVGVASYAGLALLLFAFQPKLVYYPEIGRGIEATPERLGLAFEPVRIATEDGLALDGWFVPAAKERAVVLYFHGNAGNISHRLDTLEIFHKLGLATLIFDYRGYGRSEGRPSEEGTYRDAKAAWWHLTESRRIPPERIVYFGESLGGAVAAWLAARHPPRALILTSVFTSAPDLAADLYPWLPARKLTRFRYDTLAHVRGLDCPVFIAHARNDEIVPFAHGRRLYDAARGPKRFLELAGGHNDGFPANREAVSTALAEFLDAHLGPMR